MKCSVGKSAFPSFNRAAAKSNLRAFFLLTSDIWAKNYLHIIVKKNPKKIPFWFCHDLLPRRELATCVGIIYSNISPRVPFLGAKFKF